MIGNHLFQEESDVSNETEDRSLTDIVLSMEDNNEMLYSLQEEISNIFTLRNYDSEEDIPEHTLEMAAEYDITLEDYTTTSIKSLFLSDFSTIYRTFQKLTDVIRDNRANVIAYRKKTKSKQAKIRERINSKDAKNGEFSVSLEGILPYLTRASDSAKWNSNPGNILDLLEKDNADIAKFINSYPKAILAELKKVESILKSFKGSTEADFQRQVVNKIETLTHPMDMVDPLRFNDADTYLARTIFMSSFNPKKLKSDGATKMEVLGKPFKLDMIDTRSPEDTRRILEMVVPFIGNIMGMIRKIEAPYWKLSAAEAKRVYEAQEGVIDNAEAILDANIKLTGEIADVLKSINSMADKFSEIDGIKGDFKLIQGYIDNLTQAHRGFFGKLADRQIRLARGLNFVLVRMKFIVSN